ncbi:tandem-95 repeat protein [Arcobacter roscoffensis]|uniref:Tandem-95 repeat protein n=1 Tax=Arcobacter roscoffensis TaxID=2961520 RepID=A0ABY5E3Q7_9BACT|nr:tandem-95 repeat protein [Arcobacter roscoffensis]UTJ05800.1 tandem-95 repeat protein [Arcobacter roscoffensis]
MITISKYGQNLSFVENQNILILDNLELNKTIKIKLSEDIKYSSQLVEEDLAFEFIDKEGNSFQLILKDMATLLAQNDGTTLVDLILTKDNEEDEVIASISDLATALQASAAGAEEARSGDTYNNPGFNNASENGIENRNYDNARIGGDNNLPSNALGNQNAQDALARRNFAPKIDDIDAQIVDEDKTLIFTFNATDRDNDTLIVNASSSDGTISLNGNEIIFTPNENFNGQTTIVLNVSDGKAITTKSINVIVSDINDEPKLETVSTFEVEEDGSKTITFAANDIDGTVNTTAVANNGTVVVNGNEITYTPNANFNGSDTLTITTIDDDGAKVVKEVAVTVNSVNDAPIIESQTISVQEDQILRGTVIANDIDLPSGEKLVFSTIDIVDGFSIDQDGNYEFDASDYDYLKNGEEEIISINIDVEDELGEQSSNKFTIKLTGEIDTPTLEVVSATTLDEDSSKTITFTASDLDGTVTTTAIANNGSVVINGSEITYSPNENFNGRDTITLTTTDDDGAKVVKEVEVTVNSVNDAPVIENISTQTVAEDNTKIVTIDVSDIDGDDLTKTVSTTNGAAIINNDGNIEFTPNANFNGMAVVTLDVNDGTTTASKTFNVNVTAVNDVPIANNDSGFEISENVQSLEIDVLSNDSDVENSPLSISSFTQPLKGSVQLNSTGDKLEFIPGRDFDYLEKDKEATVVFTYTVSDGELTNDTTVTLTVKGTNDAPQITAKDPIIVLESDLNDATQGILETVVTNTDGIISLSISTSNSTIVKLFEQFDVSGIVNDTLIELLNIPASNVSFVVDKSVAGTVTINAEISGLPSNPFETAITQENLKLVILDNLGMAFNLPFENAVYSNSMEITDLDNIEDVTVSLGQFSVTLTTTSELLISVFEQISGISSIDRASIQSLLTDILSGDVESTTESKSVTLPASAVKLLETAGLLNVVTSDLILADDEITGTVNYQIISPIFNMMNETDSLDLSFDYSVADGIDTVNSIELVKILGTNDTPVAIADTVNTESSTGTYYGTLPGAYNLDMFKTVLDNIDTSNGLTEIIDQTELQNALLTSLADDVNIDVSSEKIAEIQARVLPNAFASLGLTTDDILPALTSLTDPINNKVDSLQDKINSFPATIKNIIETKFGELTAGSSKDLQLDNLINDFVSKLLNADQSGAETAAETLGLALFDIYESPINYSDITDIKKAIVDIKTNTSIIVNTIVDVIETQIDDTTHTRELETLVENLIASNINETTFTNSLFTIFESSVTPIDLSVISTSIPTIISGISIHTNVETLRTDLISNIELAISTQLNLYPVLNPSISLIDVVTQFVSELEAENTDADSNLVSGLISIYGPSISIEATNIQIAVSPLLITYTNNVQNELVSQIVNSIETQIGDTTQRAQLTSDVIQLLSDIESNPSSQDTILDSFANGLFITFNASVTPSDLVSIQTDIASIQSNPSIYYVTAMVEAIESQIGVEDTPALRSLITILVVQIEANPSDETLVLEAFVEDLFTLYNATVTLDDLLFIRTSIETEANALSASISDFPMDLANTLIVDSLDLTLDTTNWTGDVSPSEYQTILNKINNLLLNAKNNPLTFDATEESKILLIETTDLLGLDLNQIIIENLPSDITNALDNLETSLSLDPDAIIANLDINQLLVDLGIDINNIDYNEILNDTRIKITESISSLSPSDLVNNPDAISDTFKDILDTIFAQENGILTSVIDNLIDITDVELKDAIVNALSDAIITEISTEMDALISALKNNFGKESEVVTMSIETISNPVVTLEPNNGGLSVNLTKGIVTLNVATYSLGEEITVTVNGEDSNGETVSYNFDFVVVDDGGTLKLSDTPNYDKLGDEVIQTIVAELTQDVNLSVDEIKSITLENIFAQLGLDRGLLFDETRDEIADKMVQDLYYRISMDEDLQDIATLTFKEVSDSIVTTVYDENGLDITDTLTLSNTIVNIQEDGSYSVTNEDFEVISPSYDIEVEFAYKVVDKQGVESEPKKVTVEIDLTDTYTPSETDNEIDMSTLLSNTTGLDELDLDSGEHILSNFTLEDFVALTDEDNSLRILGDEADSIKLETSQNWEPKLNTDGSTYKDADGFQVYTTTNTQDEVLKLLIEDSVTVEI